MYPLKSKNPTRKLKIFQTLTLIHPIHSRAWAKITIFILPFSREPARASFLWQSEGIFGEDVWANPDKEGV